MVVELSTGTHYEKPDGMAFKLSPGDEQVFAFLLGSLLKRTSRATGQAFKAAARRLGALRVQRATCDEDGPSERAHVPHNPLTGGRRLV